MLTARGFVTSDGKGLVGTFDVNGSSHHLSVDIKPRDQVFQCSNATLSYSDDSSFMKDCKLSGTIGKDELQMNFVGGVSIVGLLDTPRLSSVLIRGVGMWNTGAIPLLDRVNSFNEQQESGADAPASHFPLDAVEDPYQRERETQLLQSGDPIIAYVIAHLRLLIRMPSRLQHLWPVWRRKIDGTLRFGRRYCAFRY